jgi:hypothetical protein
MRTAIVVVLALAVVACNRRGRNDPDPPTNGGGDEETTNLAEDGADSTAAENDSEALTSTLIGSGGAGGGGIGLASASDLAGGGLGTREIGDGAKALYFPRGCLTVTPGAGSTPLEGTAKYEFNGCTGPAGLLNIRGVVDVTYKATLNHLTLDLVASGVQVNRATVDWTAHAEIDAVDAARTMVWKASLTGTTARGREISRTNEKVIDWTVGEPCVGIDGVSQGNLSGRNVKTEVNDFRRCRGSCPEAGGSIVVTHVDKNVSVEIKYDGTNQATLIHPKGETKIALFCGR